MIVGYVGLIGHGKTMLGVDDAITTAKRRGALLASNIRLSPPEDVEFVQLAVGVDGIDMDSLRALVDRVKGEGRGCVLFLDEIGIMMPARFWQTFPVDLMFMVSQSRKLGIDIIWTAQDIEQVDSFVRRLTQWAYKVRAIPAPSLERRERGRRPFLFRVTHWRPAQVDKQDSSGKSRRTAARWIRYRREREGWYDTDELVAPPPRLAQRGARKRGEVAGLVVSSGMARVPEVAG